MKNPELNQLMTVHTQKSVFGLVRKENKTKSEVRNRLGAAYLDVVEQEITVKFAGIKISHKSFNTLYGEQDDKSVKQGIGFSVKS